MPTTVLSQADSGVGVKNSINLFGKKNFIGTFVPPFAVINDSRFLDSLDRRDRVAGVVEAIKVALLRDPDFYGYMERHADDIAAGRSDVIEALIRRSAELHLAHICGNGDPFEFGSARPLDFGHWAAHKLESMTAHRLRHGEAVAIGITLDLIYSVRKQFLDRVTAERIISLLIAVGLPVWDEATLQREANGTLTLIQGLREFREHLGGELHVTLLRGIGESFEVTEMDETAGRRVDHLAGGCAAEPPRVSPPAGSRRNAVNVGRNLHLTYCSNIHPGESWPEVYAAIAASLPRVRALLRHEGPMAIGLRLSARAAEALSRRAVLEEFLGFLSEGDYYVPTLNGFPYGTFHGARVKERVYLPDWRDHARIDYTNRLARLLATMLGARSEIEGSVSTVPGAFRSTVLGEGDRRADRSRHAGARRVPQRAAPGDRQGHNACDRAGARVLSRNSERRRHVFRDVSVR